MSTNSTAEGGAGGGGGTSKAAWAPLRKRLAVMRTVRIFSKDSAKGATAAAAGQPMDDGGVYCGDEGGGGSDAELEDCAKGSPVLGSGAAAAASAAYNDNDDVGNDEESPPSGAGEAAAVAAAAAAKGRAITNVVTTAASQLPLPSQPPVHALFLRHRGSRAPEWSEGRGSLGSGEFADEVRRLSTCSQYEESRRASNDLQLKAAKAKKKSIGEKFSFLSRKSTDAPAAAEKPFGLRTFKPSSDQVQRWGVSFDCLLNDKYGLALFRAFLKTEYSDENIEFWIACEEYRSLSGLKKQTLKAQKIYTEFVAFQAPREVNLDSTTRLATIKSMGSPDSHLFEQAQKRIQALMEKDSYQRFLRSDVYQAILKEAPTSSSGSGAASTKNETAAAQPTAD